jgi:large subunit ribosomal protein L15
MQLNTLTISTGITKARRVGRGGKRGKTSGKGHKGQKSRAGHKIRPAERDMIKRIPKLRGHGKNRSRTVNSSRVRPTTVNLHTLEANFEAGDRVDAKVLVAKRLIRAIAGRVPTVKILGQGTLTKKLTIAQCELSETAKAAVEKVGGTVLI